MGKFLSYSIISGIIMLALYSSYRLLLARDNQHNYNRVILLFIYVVSFSVVPVQYPLNALFSNSANDAEARLYALDIINLNEPTETPIWGVIIIWTFIAGMAVVTMKTIFTWLRLYILIHSGKKIHRAGHTLILTPDDKFSPFSWMKYVVINESDYNDNGSVILLHEKTHIASWHWLDLIIAQIVCIINWFNPASWLMRDELMLVHEYQADMAVIDSGYDVRQYQKLLIRKAVGARFPSLTNSLNHSKLKKRITMMYKEKSGAGQKIKALALVPVLALALGVAAVPSVQAAVSTISSLNASIDKGNEKKSNRKTVVQVFEVKNLNNNGNVTTITIKGKGLGDHITVSGGTFTTMGKTYQAKSMKCDMTNGTAIITVTFPFISEFENSSMTINVNGEKIPFMLDNFFNNAQTLSIDSKDGSITSLKDSKGIKALMLNECDIYLDGKKIGEATMESLTSDDIAAITIDRQKNEIRITSKP